MGLCTELHIVLGLHPQVLHEYWPVSADAVLRAFHIKNKACQFVKSLALNPLVSCNVAHELPSKWSVHEVSRIEPVSFTQGCP